MAEPDGYADLAEAKHGEGVRRPRGRRAGGPRRRRGRDADPSEARFGSSEARRPAQDYGNMKMFAQKLKLEGLA